jgi:PAS domain S-box-containing protein
MIKILAIDDNRDNLTVITALLKNLMPEWAVITAPSGPEGIEKALMEHPDTVLLDIHMPGMDGFETCRRLKADERTRPIPVVMITAVRTDAPSRIKSLEAGADAFLSKPIDEQELVSQLKVALRIKAAEDALRAERDSLEASIQERTAELLESEKRFRAASDASLDCMILLRSDRDEAGRIRDFIFVELNRRTEEMLGRSRDHMIGKRLCEELPINREAGFFEKYKRVAETGEPLIEEFFLPETHVPGCWYFHQVVRMNDGIFICHRDISERKQAERVLRESEAAVRKKLNAILEPDGDIGTLNLADIMDHEALQTIMADFYKFSKIGCAIVDISGKVLVSIGWQDICTKFHRVHPDTAKNCMESDLILANGIPAGTFKIYRCMNNLWDMVTPIEVGGKHLGNIYLGQFFFEDEIPDYALFRRQARQYGFDETEYLAALDRVPRWSRETVESVMTFYARLAGMISSLSYNAIILSRTLAQKNKADEALLNANELLTFAQSAARAGMWDWDMSTGILNWSPEMFTLFGFDPNTSRPAFDLWRSVLHPEDCQKAEERINQAIMDHTPLENEYRIVTPSGQMVWIGAQGNTSYAADGTPLRMSGICIDITARKQAELALSESEARFRQMFEKHDAIMLLIEPQTGLIIDINQAATKFYGYKKSKLCGMNIKDLNTLPPEQIAEERRKALNEKRNYFVFTHRLANGTERIVEVHSSPISVNEKQVLFSIIHDITERKQMEECLRESEERFKSLHNASFGGIAIHDKGIILECNQGMADMTGYSAAELTGGMDGLLLIAEKSRNDVMNKILSGYEKPYEAIGLRKNGEEYPMRLEGRNVPYKGKMVRTVEFRDITEQKRVEAEREKLHAQLVQAQKMETVGRLAGGVAHDFNNMLGVILGHTEMALEKTNPGDALHEDLTEIITAGQRSADLTRQLLTFARKQTIAPRVIDINETVEGMLKMLRRLVGENIDLLWKPGGNPGPVKVDPSQIDQVLANLCVNARDAIKEVGKITIETGDITFDEFYCRDHKGLAPGEYVLLAVNDNGCGMDPETLDHLFEPFFTTKELGKGTGLGLASVYGMVKQNNGFINVYSERGQGTAFKIFLPRHADKSALVPENRQDQPAERGIETILLVEDEPAILKMTKVMLEKLGYTVIVAHAPEEAIRLANENNGRIDLLMTDVVMPGMNGRDLAGNLLSIHPGMKRLFMSGYTANVIAHHGVLDEGVHFIEKPFSRKDLAAKVRKALGE